jgi:signal transduction histidine kinase
MKESANNIYRLLENLLEWSRLKRGMMDFIPVTFNATQKITECIEVLVESARKKEIKVTYSLPEDLTIYADSHMFETIIRNLVSNAIKFTPKSGEICVSASTTPDNSVEIKISDTGIGMDKELIGKLFQLNEKTSRKGTEGEPSTGLGLLLCKEFIEKHGGKIWVESEEGKGSTFVFTIPEKV